MMTDDRERYWQSRLRRLRFGAEPLRVQVEKYRRANVAMSVLCGAIALMFAAIFAGFRRPAIGLLIDAVVLAPIVAVAWIDWVVLKRRFEAYAAEVRDEE